MKKTMFFFLQSIAFLFVALFTFFERVISSISAKSFFSFVKSLFSILKWHFTRLKLLIVTWCVYNKRGRLSLLIFPVCVEWLEFIGSTYSKDAV